MLQGNIPSADEMRSVGESIGGAINPNAKYLNALKLEVAKNPETRQQLVDMEAKNPGTLTKLFGSSAASLFGNGNVSASAQQEMFNTIHATDAPGTLPNTMQGMSASRTMGGGTPDQLANEKSVATINASKASIAPEMAAADSSKAKLDTAKNLADLINVPIIAQNEAQKAGKEVEDRTLISQTEANPLVQKNGGIISTLMNNPKLIPDASKSAIMNDPGYYRLYQEQQTTRRYNLMAARDDARDNRQRADINDSIMKQDAESKSALAAKFGLSVEADDMYQIKKNGLVSIMDQLVGMNGAQLHDAASKNPAIDAVIQHPSMVQSWQHWQATTQQIQDKDIQAQRKDYNKSITDLQLKAKKGELIDQSSAQQAISDLTSHPYADIQNSKGTPLPIPHFDSKAGSNGLFNSKNNLYFTDPHTGKVIDPSVADAPTTTPQQSMQLDQIAQSIASGKSTYKETINDKRFKQYGSGAEATLGQMVNKYRTALLQQNKQQPSQSP